MLFTFGQGCVTMYLSCYVINTHTFAVYPVCFFVAITRCTFLYSGLCLVEELDLLLIKRRNFNWFWSTSDSIHTAHAYLPYLESSPKSQKHWLKC